MIDLELVIVMSCLTCARLIVAVRLALGLSRTEKLLGATFFVAGVAMMPSANLMTSTELPELTTQKDFDEWLADMRFALRLVDGFWWVGVTAAVAFLLVALHHLWRDRATVWKKLT